MHEGVLTMSGGPNYESVAELRMFSMLGVMMMIMHDDYENDDNDYDNDDDDNTRRTMWV